MARPKAYKGHNPLYGHACAAFSTHSATIQVKIPKCTYAALQAMHMHVMLP